MIHHLDQGVAHTASMPWIRIDRPPNARKLKTFDTPPAFLARHTLTIRVALHPFTVADASESQGLGSDAEWIR